MANEVPSWVTAALQALGPLATNASRQTKLGYGGLVQNVANTLGYPIPTPQQETRFPYGPTGGMPPVKHDLAGEQFRTTLGELTPGASAYIGQVPVGDVWTDKAPLANTQWNAVNNPAVGYSGWQAGTAAESIAPGLPPFAATYTGRLSPKPATPGIDPPPYNNRTNDRIWIPEVWDPQPDPNGSGSNGLDLRPGTGIWVDNWQDHWTDPPPGPDIPGIPDPSTTNLPMGADQQMGLKISLYRAILKQAGGINHSRFDQDLATYINQNPQILSDIEFLNKPFYKDMPSNDKLDQAWSKLGAKYGGALKNTPIGNHYEGILK